MIKLSKIADEALTRAIRGHTHRTHGHGGAQGEMLSLDSTTTEFTIIFIAFEGRSAAMGASRRRELQCRKAVERSTCGAWLTDSSVGLKDTLPGRKPFVALR